MAKKLLIIDDSFLVRSGLEGAFKKSGKWEISLAENGKIGLEKILSEKPDIVIMDIEMPEMDGLATLKEIGSKKRSGEILKSLPVIILSGTMYENDENIRRAKMLGASDVMAKPMGKSSTVTIDVTALQERMEKLLA
ncbi:response regulator [Sediminispirochaeta bajacaliforniensis]|uniref:response regulator n=1 Tax=Sediminispirochaeta bajacaliforniensis TaxID=148 RepID=UPI00036FA5C0|nr:response regulator [Sediminispirochaeta bajacaliforniensis]